MEQLTAEERVRLMEAAIEQFYLYEGGPVLANIGDGWAEVTYDPVRGVSRVAIPIERNEAFDPGTLTMTGDPREFIRVLARSLNPKTLEEEVIPREVMSAALEEQDHIIFPYQLVIETPGTFLAWSDVAVAPGLLADDDPLAVRFFHTGGLSGADAVMSLRPFIPGLEGRQLLTPPTYGAPEPQYLPPITDAEQLAATMEATARETLQRHIAAGDVTQEEVDAMLRRFEQERELRNLHPVPKAALQIAFVFQDTGGDRLIDVLLGQNHSRLPVQILFDGDPELANIGDGRLIVTGDGATLWQVHDSSAPKGYRNILILSKVFANREEPVEILATLLIHELLAHERYDASQYNSLGEETLGSLVETWNWAQLVIVQPELLRMQTPDTQFRNLLLMVLLNSQNQPPSRGVGVMSEHAPSNYNALPNNNVGQVWSFADFVRMLMANHPEVKLTPVSYGTVNTREMLIAMFGNDPEIIQEITALDMNNDGYPDFSDNFIRFLDRNLHRLISNEEAVELARLLGLEIQSGGR